MFGNINTKFLNRLQNEDINLVPKTIYTNSKQVEIDRILLNVTTAQKQWIKCLLTSAEMNLFATSKAETQISDVQIQSQGNIFIRM